MRGTRGRRKFTLAQQEACYAIMLRPGTNQHNAAKILSTVGFERLPPFSISPASVYRISRELRATRAPDGTKLSLTEPLDAVDQLTRDAIEIAQRSLARLESLEHQGKLEPAKMRQWLAVLRELRAQAAKVAPKPDKPHDEAENGSKADDELAWLGTDEEALDSGDAYESQPTISETDMAAGSRSVNPASRDDTHDADSGAGAPSLDTEPEREPQTA